MPTGSLNIQDAPLPRIDPELPAPPAFRKNYKRRLVSRGGTGKNCKSPEPACGKLLILLVPFAKVPLDSRVLITNVLRPAFPVFVTPVRRSNAQRMAFGDGVGCRSGRVFGILREKKT
jgi:hypothetical protein